MNRISKTISSTINSVVKNNTNKTVNIFILNNDNLVKQYPINKVTKIRQVKQVKVEIENIEEMKYLEKKSLEFALKN